MHLVTVIVLLSSVGLHKARRIRIHSVTFIVLNSLAEALHCTLVKEKYFDEDSANFYSEIVVVGAGLIRVGLINVRLRSEPLIIVIQMQCRSWLWIAAVVLHVEVETAAANI